MDLFVKCHLKLHFDININININQVVECLFL